MLDAQLSEGPLDQGTAPFGREPKAPRLSSQPVPKFGPRTCTSVLRAKAEPSQESAGLFADGRPHAESREPIIRPQDVRQDRLLDELPRQSLAVQEAHDFRVAVQLIKQIDIGHGEPPQKHPTRCHIPVCPGRSTTLVATPAALTNKTTRDTDRDRHTGGQYKQL